MKITLWDSVQATSGRAVDVSWEHLAEMLRADDVYAGDARHGGWSAAVFLPCTRRKLNVTAVTALVLDFDGTATAEQISGYLSKYDYIIHSTKRHTASVGRYRVVVRLSRDLKPGEYARIWAKAQQLCANNADESTKDESRFWYLPGVISDGPFLAQRKEGVPIDVDAWLTTPDEVRAALYEATKAIRTAPRGERNRTMAKEAFGLGGYVASSALDEGEAARALLKATEVGGWDPEERERTEGTLRRQLEAGAARPRYVEPPATIEPMRGEKGPTLVERPPPILWICRSLQLAAGRPTLLCAFGGTGKTWVAMTLALATATGTPAFGSPIQHPGPVVHLNYEMSKYEIRRRYQRLAVGINADLEKADLEVCSREHMGGMKLSDSDALPKLMATLRGKSLCIVDSFRASVGGLDENSSEVRAPLDVLTEVTDATGCAIVVIHHESKPGTDAKDAIFRTRGSGAIVDACDTTWHLVPDRSVIRLEQGKVSLDEKVESFFLRMRDVGPVDPYTSKTTGLIVEMVHEEEIESIEKSFNNKLKNAVLNALSHHKELTVSQLTRSGDIVKGKLTSKLSVLKELELADMISVRDGKSGSRIVTLTDRSECLDLGHFLHVPVYIFPILKFPVFGTRRGVFPTHTP